MRPYPGSWPPSNLKEHITPVYCVRVDSGFTSPGNLDGLDDAGTHYVGRTNRNNVLERLPLARMPRLPPQSEDE